VQRLARDAAKVEKLREEVTQVQANVVTVGVCAARAEETAREKVVLLEAARGKEAEADQRACTGRG
jgi:hypothetical protein